MAERDIPLSVFHFDCFWMRAVPLVRLRLGPGDLPRPGGHARAGCTTKGLKVCVWINPYIAQRSRAVRGGRARPATCSRAPDGVVWQSDQWQAGMGLVDFTNPDAVGLVQRASSTRCSDMGVDCFKTDFGERIPTDVVWHDGSRPASGCTTTTRSSTTRRSSSCSSRARRGRGGGVRPLGHRRRPAVPGALGRRLRVDLRVDGRVAARRAVAAVVAASASGATTSAASRAPRTPALFKRWVAFGLLSSHSRLHGSGSYRVPWAFDEEAVDVLRHFTRLKLRLMPYLARRRRRRRTENGMPMMRPMVAGVPRRPGRGAPRPPVHARRRPAGRAGVHRRRRGRVLRARRHLDLTAHRRAGHRARLGAETHGFDSCRCSSGPARCSRSARATTGRTTTGPTASRCGCSSSPTGTGRSRGSGRELRRDGRRRSASRRGHGAPERRVSAACSERDGGSRVSSPPTVGWRTARSRRIVSFRPRTRVGSRARAQARRPEPPRHPPDRRPHMTTRASGRQFPPTSSGARPRRRTRSRARSTRTAAGRPSGTRSATTPGKVLDGDTGDVAADHYHRVGRGPRHHEGPRPAGLPVLDRLAARAADRLGRVQPGRPRLLRRLVDGLHRARHQARRHALPLGPAAAARGRGRLGQPRHGARFEDYARSSPRRSATGCHLWTTLNEPWCSAFLGYASGVHAPGRHRRRRRRSPRCTTSTSRTAWPAARSRTCSARTRRSR